VKAGVRIAVTAEGEVMVAFLKEDGEALVAVALEPDAAAEFAETVADAARAARAGEPWPVPANCANCSGPMKLDGWGRLKCATPQCAHFDLPRCAGCGQLHLGDCTRLSS